MDEVNIAQQYYIATRSSPADERTRVLKYGEMFAVFDRFGDIEPLGMGEQGIFFQGTRHVSEFVAYLWNSRPLLLSSTINNDNVVFTADLANVDVYYRDQIKIPRDTLHLRRSSFLWRGVCYEEFEFVNYGLSPITVPFRIAFGSDFADIFEVRGMRRERRGYRRPDRIGSGKVELGYEGLDQITRRTLLEFAPEPTSLSASEASFEVNLTPRQSRQFCLSIACDQDSKQVVSYGVAMSAAINAHGSTDTNLCRIRSTNDRFSRWIDRSLSDIEMMTAGNPETDYPYAGVPWFSTVFGRDGIITALQTLWINPAIGKGVLRFLASTQAQEIDREREAEPGKILHELRCGEMARMGEVPFGKYYGTVDATPLFIMLAGAFYDHTGDREFLSEIWANIDLALQWIDLYGDIDGDGFVEYAQHSNKGLVQQGWKDSNDSVFHSDGSLAAPPIALCEVQGYVYAAKVSASRIAELLGHPERASELAGQAAQLRRKFDTEFWCPDISNYALALDGSKRPCRVRASNAGHCLYTGIASPGRAEIVAHSLLSPEFFTGWGIRTIAAGEARYNPISYHNGSVWPHDNSLIAAGLSRYGFKDLAGRILLGFLDTSSHVELVRLPELFCGFERRRGAGPTLYPVACAPQSWAAGAVFMFLQACLGISVDGAGKKVTFVRPTLPQGIPQLSLKGLRVGAASLDLLFQRRGHTVTIDLEERKGDAEVVIA